MTPDPGQVKTVHAAFPVSGLAVTPGGIQGDASPRVDLGRSQVQIGTPAGLTADFAIQG